MPFARLLLLLLVACSGSGSSDMPGPDSSSTGDGGTDAREPQTGTVNIRISGYPGVGTQPQYYADTPVVFFKPDGSIGSVVNTDANGRASATIERGSLVAFVKGQNWVHVHGAIANPGDNLVFGPGDDKILKEPNGSLRVSWPARVIAGYTVYYYVSTPCGYSGETTSTSITIPLYKSCASGPIDVAVTSRRSSQGVTGVMTRRAVQPTGGIVDVNLGDGGATWLVGGTATVNLANLPTATSLSTSCTGVQYLDKMSFHSDGGFTSSTSCSMRVMLEPQSTLAVEASIAKNGVDRFAVQMRQTFPHGTSPYGPLDAANHLPFITNLSIDPIGRNVVWASEGDATIDASVLRIETEGRYLIWRIVAPNGLPKSFKLPTLPAELATYDLKPTDTLRVSLVNMDFVGVTAAEFMATNLDDEDGLPDKPRRGATARTP